MKRVLQLISIAIISAIIVSTSAYAIPILQLYAEGATYDYDTESWVLTPEGSSSGEPFIIWAIGNVDGPGGAGDISNVKLAVAYDKSFSPEISITSTTASPEFGFADPSTPADPVWLRTVTDGSVPQLSSGKDLPSHGEYGEDTYWQEYYLGDFTLTDSPTADFIGSFPTEIFPETGQINAYSVSVTGLHGGILHFDLYDSVKSGTKATFSPFSHDAVGASIVPEPTSLLLLGTGLGVLGLIGSRKKKK